MENKRYSLMSLSKDNFVYNLSLDNNLNCLELSQVNESMIKKQGEFVASTIQLPTTPRDIIYIRDILNDLIENNENKYYLEESFVKLRSFKNFDKDIIETIIKELYNVKGIEKIYIQDENNVYVGLNFNTFRNKYFIEYYPTIDDMKQFLYMTIYDKYNSTELLRFFKEDNIETIFKQIKEHENFK